MNKQKTNGYFLVEIEVDQPNTFQYKLPLSLRDLDSDPDFQVFVQPDGEIFIRQPDRSWTFCSPVNESGNFDHFWSILSEKYEESSNV
jgi:hypothetical protein|tara:strand:- start:57 stop:320 length:264 start_codon:yes stop_codon:yes gene_type:complete